MRKIGKLWRKCGSAGVQLGLLGILLVILTGCGTMLSTEKNGDLNKGSSESLLQEAGQEDFLFESILRGTGKQKSKAVTIKGVPCVLYYTDDYETKQVLFLQHGLLSQKEEMEGLASELAKLGCLVVTPDAAAHGELKSKEIVSLPQLIVQTAAHFEMILADLQKSECIDKESVGMVGFSLGGLSSLYYAQNSKVPPAFVVSMCGTPRFEDFLGTDAAYLCIKNGKLTQEKNSEKQAETEKEIQSLSPYEKMVADAETRYYLLCCDRDEIVPYQGNLDMYSKKQEDGNITLLVKEGQGHTFVEEDLWSIVSYVEAQISKTAE